MSESCNRTTPRTEMTRDLKMNLKCICNTHTHTQGFRSQHVHLCMHALQPVTINCRKRTGSVWDCYYPGFSLLPSSASRCVSVYVHMCVCICLCCFDDSLGAPRSICCCADTRAHCECSVQSNMGLCSIGEQGVTLNPAAIWSIVCVCVCV